MSTRPSVVLFDLDGVIIDSGPLMRYAFAESYRRVVGESAAPIERYLSYSGDSFLRIMDRMELPREMYPHFREISMRRLDMIRLFPGMRAVVEELAQHVRLGIVTGKDSERTKQILEHVSLEGSFELAICSDMVRKPKPNPESVYTALEALHAEPSEAVMVGDAISDIVAARRASVPTVGVSWGMGTREHLAGVGADRLVDEPAELVPAVLGCCLPVRLGVA
jgi:AHBA synthesis associated protein